MVEYRGDDPIALNSQFYQTYYDFRQALCPPIVVRAPKGFDMEFQDIIGSEIDIEHTLTVLGLCIPDPLSKDGGTTIPLIVVCCSEPSSCPRLSEFSATVQNLTKNCLYVIAESIEEVTLADLQLGPVFSAGKMYNPRTRMGASINAIGRESSQTIGFFLQDTNMNQYALTCAHGTGLPKGASYPPDVSGFSPPEACSPSEKDQANYIKHLEKKISTWREKISHAEFDAATVTYHNRRGFQKGLLLILRDHLQTDIKEIELARTITSEMRYLGTFVSGEDLIGTCRFDWSLARIRQNERIALDEGLTPEPPTTPHLYSLDWENMNGAVGKLQLDLPVRKNGQGGMTYGWVGAIESGREKGTGLKYSEHFVIPEAKLGKDSQRPFAVPGDSGAGVITADGHAIAIVQGNYCPGKIKVLELGSGLVDLGHYKDARQADGTLLNAVEVALQVPITRVTPLDAILERAAARMNLDSPGLKLLIDI